MFYQDDQSHPFINNFRIHLPLTKQSSIRHTFHGLDEFMGKYISSPIAYDTTTIKTN